MKLNEWTLEFCVYNKAIIAKFEWNYSFTPVSVDGVRLSLLFVVLVKYSVPEIITKNNYMHSYCHVCISLVAKRKEPITL